MSMTYRERKARARHRREWAFAIIGGLLGVGCLGLGAYVAYKKFIILINLSELLGG